MDVRTEASGAGAPLKQGGPTLATPCRYQVSAGVMHLHVYSGQRGTKVWRGLGFSICRVIGNGWECATVESMPN